MGILLAFPLPLISARVAIEKLF